MAQLSCYQTINSYIDSNKYDECFDMFQNIDNHKIIQSNRIPHKLIIKLLQISVNKNHQVLAKNIIKYIIKYKLNYYLEYTRIFNTVCKEGLIEIAKLFLKYQSIIYPNFKMNIPLKTAIECDQLEIVTLLMDNEKVVKKLRPNMLSEFYTNNCAYKYFISHYANINMRNENVLIRAINSNDNEVANIIFNANIIHDINIDNEFLMYTAMYNNNLEIVKMLLNYKQKPKMELFNCGFTHACYKGNIEVIEHVLKCASIKIDDIKYINSLCNILFPYIDMNSNVAKIISLLVEYDIINNNVINYVKCHRSVDNYLNCVIRIEKLGTIYKYFIDYSSNANYSKSNHLLDQLLCIYKYNILYSKPNDP